MIYQLLFLLFLMPLLGITPGSVVALSGGSSIFYPVDSGQRGTEIVNTFNSLLHTAGTFVPEVSLQTTGPIPIYPGSTQPYRTYSYIVNGQVPYIQNITETTHNTLLIVSYLAVKSAATRQYIVLPPEQVSALLYFKEQSNLPVSSAPFVSPPISGTTPYYSVDSRHRAVDIVSAATQLMAAPFKNGNVSQVWIQTTLTGPFNPQLNNNGLLKNVTSLSVSSSLIRINFLPPNFQGTTQTVFVFPEQVQWIIYIRDSSYPQGG